MQKHSICCKLYFSRWKNSLHFGFSFENYSCWAFTGGGALSRPNHQSFSTAHCLQVLHLLTEMLCLELPKTSPSHFANCKTMPMNTFSCKPCLVLFFKLFRIFPKPSFLISDLCCVISKPDALVKILCPSWCQTACWMVEIQGPICWAGAMEQPRQCL